MAYFNSDGLYKKYGTEKAVPNKGGEYRNVGSLRELEFTFNLASLSATPIILSDTVFMPVGVRIEEVELVVLAAAVGASTLSVGLVATDRTTVLGSTIFLAAITQATMTPIGTKTVYRIGVTGVGTGIGVTTNTVGYINALGTATPFSAGQVKVTIRYMRM